VPWAASRTARSSTIALAKEPRPHSKANVREYWVAGINPSDIFLVHEVCGVTGVLFMVCVEEYNFRLSKR
jgi:hypothetical protein